MTRIPVNHLLLAAVCTSFVSCHSAKSDNDAKRQSNQVSEYIQRHADEYLFQPDSPQIQPAPVYAWNAALGENSLPKITKEYFRCRGTEFNPMRVIAAASSAPDYLHDCSGTDRHSLPLRNQEEFIYPVLIDLLNHVQKQTGKRVVITSGHRCPAHNRYVDESSENSASKHMMGAAVSFYVQGLEEQPDAIIDHIQNYYVSEPKYRGLKDYLTFKRDHSEKQSSKTPLWLNQEVAIRLYNKSEGRNFDNRHPYPYIALTVRYDWDLKEKVTYSWEKAQRNFLRW